MPGPTQLIYSDTSPDYPAVYKLPPGLDLKLQSVVAKWDLTGASGSAKLCLDVLAQDGKLMGRFFPDTAPTTGDTARVTYAPFLRSPPAVTPAGTTTIPGFHGHKNTALILANSSDGRLNWDEWTIDGGTTYFQAGTLVGAALSDVKLMLAGWYAIECWAGWSAQPASGFAAIAAVDDDTNISEPRKAQGMNYPVNFSSAPALAFQQVRYYPADFTETQTFAWVNRLEFWVVQNSGVSRTIDEAYCNIAYLGARLP